MKRLVPWLFASAAVMLMLPALAVRFVNAEDGMAACLALSFVADPLFSVCVGVCAGRDPNCKPQWRQWESSAHFSSKFSFAMISAFFTGTHSFFRGIA